MPAHPGPVEACHMPASRPTTDEALLIAALRRGDEDAFVTLIDRYGAVMVRVAQSYVGSRAVAEEIVQETWVAVLSGVERFEGRSSVKTWMFRIHKSGEDPCTAREPLRDVLEPDLRRG